MKWGQSSVGAMEGVREGVMEGMVFVGVLLGVLEGESTVGLREGPAEGDREGLKEGEVVCGESVGEVEGDPFITQDSRPASSRSTSRFSRQVLSTTLVLTPTHSLRAQLKHPNTRLIINVLKND